jgi:hypothetical protein
MKKLLLLSGLMVAALGAHAQGTLVGANFAPGVDAPVTNAMVNPAVRAAGSAFNAQLYIGPAGTTSSGLLTTNGVGGAPIPFQSGAGAGYFLGGQRTIEGFAAASTITVQVRAWATANGASWEAAGPLARGESNLIQVTLGGGALPPANLLGLQGFAVGVVPEPSSIALGLLGLGAIVLFRRRK